MPDRTEPPQHPVRFDAAMERPTSDEEVTIAKLIDTMRSIMEKTYHGGGHATRGVHAKSHGLLIGELTVLGDLPPSLAQGLFAEPRTYPVVIRFSTIPGDILDDEISVPRAVAIKVIGVEGARLPGSEGEVTQDFLLVNGKAFPAPDPKSFLNTVRVLASTTNQPQLIKKVVSAVARGTERVMEAVGSESALLQTLGGHSPTHILCESFFSQAPTLYGEYIAKFTVEPVSANLIALKQQVLDLAGHPTAIRDAVIEFFKTQTGTWELRAQLCSNLETMPIEDASVVWPEEESPYIPVARMTVRPQIGWSELRSKAIDDGMAFSPWHGLAAHRPVGGVMRARKAVYEASARYRAEHNHTPIRLSPIPTTSGVPPLSRVKFGVGQGVGVAYDAEKRAEGVVREQPLKNSGSERGNDRSSRAPERPCPPTSSVNPH